MNLVKLSEELEYVPKDQLANMAQDPNNRFPQYLVLSEIQRRTQMEKMYAAAAQRPETTVSEEVVNNFADMPSDSNDVFSQEGMSAPMQGPMQMAASGGITGYANGGFFENRYGSDENFNYSKLGTDALGLASVGLMFVPGVGLLSLGARGIGAAYKGLKGIDYARKAKQAKDLAARGAQATKTGLLNTVSKPDPRYNALQPGIRRIAQNDGTYKRIDNITGKIINPRNFDLNRASISSTAAALGLQGASYAMQDDAVKTPEPEKKELSEFEKAKQKAELAVLEANKENKSKFNFDNVDTNLIGLGGVVMGSSNAKELGAGLTNFATGLSQAKSDASKAEYYAANTAKIQEEIDNMPLDRVLTSLTAAQKQYEAALEQGTEEQKQEAYNIVRALSKRAIKLQGLEQMVGASADANLAKSFMT